MSLLKKILLGVFITLGAMVLVVIILGGSLLARISRPGATTFGDDDPAQNAAPLSNPATFDKAPTPLPDMSISEATPTGDLHVTADIDPEAGDVLDPSLEFEALPLADLFPQSQLSAAQLAAMKAQNADKKNFINILLIGVDRRGTKGTANADVLMIATLDKYNDRLKLTSILRDCYVPIPEYGPDRINSSLSKGGVPLLMQTLNETLQMELSNYVLVDFRMFEKIVDKMGGVGVNMTAAEISAANDNIAGLNKQWGVDYLWDGFIFANPGSVRLNGKQALAYARIRHLDSDFVRTSRQFKVLSAIFAKFRSKNVAEQYATLYELLPLVETDLAATQIIDIGTSALTLNTAGLLHETVPFDGYYRSGSVKGKSALVLDMPMSAWLLHRFIYTSIKEPDEAKNYSGGPSLPPRTPSPVTPPPEEPGFAMPGADEWTAPPPTPYQPYYTWRSGPPTPAPAA